MKIAFAFEYKKSSFHPELVKQRYEKARMEEERM